MQPIIIREFPLDRIQCGAPLGNSLLGVLVWGGGRKINITFGSNSVWDHRGGLPWSSKINFADIKKALENCDERALRDIFAPPEYPAGTPSRPQVVPLGRLTLQLEEDCELLRYELHLQNSLLDIVYTQGGAEKKITFLLGRKSQKRLVFCGGNIKNICWQDSWHLSNERAENNLNTLQNTLFPEPEHFSVGGVQGFCQMLPADPGFALAFRQDADKFTVGFARGDEEIASLTALEPVSWDTLLEENNTFWQNICSRTPELTVDNAILMEMYHFGLYKFISMSDPSGVPAGLQGPWIEDDRFPPWSADYHFNINVQMCYSPALRANLAENLMPLFDMVRSWQEKLRNNAQSFVNVEDGILMPHAVDDRGTCMGGFWTGAIDHACSAWTAQMMFDYCDYTGNMDFLREFVFDFMRGVFNVYRAMMSSDADGKLRLPLSVSPEYRGSKFNAWGANASFQLAAVHRLIRNLCKAAEWLGQQPEPIWLDTAERLPEITVTAGLESEVVDRNLPEIALWENQALEYSHRHHSHLAAIAPFNTIDPEDPRWKEVVEQSRKRWIADGMGHWTGWSTAWAAQLNSHFKQPENAEMLLEIFHKVFTNSGGGTLHDAAFPGFTLYSGANEVMQIDGGMGVVAAIQEMFLYDCCGVLHIGDGIPASWRRAEIENMPAPGGFRISARFSRGRGVFLKITARRAGICRIRLDAKRQWPLPHKGSVENNVWSVALEAGETVLLEEV